MTLQSTKLYGSNVRRHDVWLACQGVNYVQAFATGIDLAKKEVSCIDLYEHFDVKTSDGEGQKTRNTFSMPYDKGLQKWRHIVDSNVFHPY